MLSINEVLQGRYLIIRQLGQGGMGTVYEAEDNKRFNKRVALKEILLDLSKISDLTQQETVRRAFEREAKILTQVDHEAFTQVIDYFTETDRQYLVMELVQGDELGELLKKRQKPFPLEDVLKWADQLLDALDYLHTLTPPIIHRDIKPQNIKLTPRGKIKLLDFGIAKGEDTQLNTIANQTFIAATLNYSPIEQILRVLDISVRAIIAYQHNEKIARLEKQNADARSDIYALGATLYHLLTNQLPVDALKRALEVWAEKPDPLINPQQINPAIPTEISDWLLKAMSVDSENRFISASEMRQSLPKNFVESKTSEINDLKTENNNLSSDSSEQETVNLEVGILFANREKTQNETEVVTSLLPFPTQSLTNEDRNQEFTKENLLSKILIDTAKENISNDSLTNRKTVISSKKHNKLFWILPVTALFLLILGGVIWKTITFPKTSPSSANENSNVNSFVNNATPLPNNENITPVSNNTANTIKKTTPINKPIRTKITTPPVSPKHPQPEKKSDANCIFDDNCR